MTAVWDNLVWLSLAIGAIAVGAGLALAGLRGLGLWRSTRAAQRVVTQASTALTAEVERMNTALAALPERQQEIERAVASLRQRALVLSVVARAAGHGSALLRGPWGYLRYLSK